MIIVAAVIIIGAIAIPTIRSANDTGGEFVRITPEARPMADGTKLGDPNAEVLIQVFEDFKCIACQSYHQNVEMRVIEEIVEPGLAYYVFHQYPFLDDRIAEKDSDRSANAAECAAEQNRFWDYNDILFANYNGIAGEYRDNRLIAFAESLDLDMDAFNACYEDQRYQDKIDEDLLLGKDMGVGGTPSLFVNGVDVSPGRVPTFEQIKAAVEEALAESGS
jgi:protein-disulfide isomerase